MKVVVSEHPFVFKHIAILRNARTKPAEFRKSIDAVAFILALEVYKDFKLDRQSIQTPLENGEFNVPETKRVILFPILRAGLEMSHSFLNVFDDAQTAHLGYYRDHNSLQPVSYYSRIPDSPQNALCLILDPMLATGGSACAAVNSLKRAGIEEENIRFCSVLSAPEGIKKISDAFPDISLYTAGVDRELNKNGYILPGMGDAGDRIFNT